MRIGPYEILLELGRGGMGAVYLARLSGDGEFERLVAVKRALPQSLSDEGTRARFLHEAKLAACVHHANVVGIHQVGSDAVGPYLACDFVEGESLAGLIERAKREGGVPARVVLRIILDALAGLAAIHDAVDTRGRRLEILHRDVSVENLLVGLDGVTRITDFGIAKSSASPIKTATGTIHGKLLYLAPEYLAGEDPPDRSCDLYAMGITMFSGLTGTYPYPIDDVTVLIEHIHSQPLPSLASRGVHATPELEAVLHKACHRERHGRFQDARELLDALERAAQGWVGVARQQEVADFVEQVAGEPLKARRAMLSKRSDMPPALPPVASAAAEAASQAHERDEAVKPWQSPALTLTEERAQVLGTRGGRTADARFVVLALLGLGAGIGGYVYLQGGEPPLRPRTPALVATPSPTPAPVPVPAPAREPSPARQQEEPLAPSPRAAEEPSQAATRSVEAEKPGPRPARPGRARPQTAAPAATATPTPALPPGLKPLDLQDGSSEQPGRRHIAVDNPYR